MSLIIISELNECERLEIIDTRDEAAKKEEFRDAETFIADRVTYFLCPLRSSRFSTMANA